MKNITNLDFDFEAIPLGTFWNSLANEAPNCYQYEMLVAQFLRRR